MDDELTPEEQDREYLRNNPHIEGGLWAEWVGVVCGWRRIPPPTLDEWQSLRANFYHGKAPVESVNELEQSRKKHV